MKEDAIVLVEAREIMQSLPPESQSDKELAMAIIGSLQSGLDKHDVQLRALDLAHQRLESKVDNGFRLVNDELNQVKQQNRESAIHQSYLLKNVESLTTGLNQAYSRIHEATVNSAVAIAKAEGAKDVAKSTARHLPIDPLMGMAMVSIALVVAFSVMAVKVERVPQQPQQQSLKDELNKFCSEKGNLCAGDGRPVRQGI